MFCDSCEDDLVLLTLENTSYGFCTNDLDVGACDPNTCEECSDNGMFCSKCWYGYSLVDLLDWGHGYCLPDQDYEYFNLGHNSECM